LLDGYREGQVLGEIWGYQTDGYYSIDDFKQTTDGVKGWQDNVWNLNEGVTSIKGTNVRPGDIKFKNLNDWGSSKNMIDAGENTESNPGDRKVIGNTTFRFQYGITASVGWKGFDLSVLLQGVGKRDIYTNDPLRFSFGQGTFSTIYDSQLDYWKPISTDVKDPNYMRPQKENPEFYRVYGSCGNVGSNQRTQTGYLLDASYLRIKNVTLSYNIPKRIINHAKIAAAKIFFSGENLHTFQNLPKGYDAERSGWGYPFYRTFSIGLSLTL
ncbi:MAG: SusC/RagA family protein, partial [Rikenellaceae bacterium]